MDSGRAPLAGERWQAAGDRAAPARSAARGRRLLLRGLGVAAPRTIRMAPAPAPARPARQHPHMTPHYWKQATRELAARDAVLRKLTAKFQGLALGSRGDAFATLARAIVGQQISVRAAQSVWDRLSDRLGTVTPELLMRARKPTL